MLKLNKTESVLNTNERGELTLSDLLERLAEDPVLVEQMAGDPVKCLKGLGIYLSNHAEKALLNQTFDKRKKRIAGAVARGDDGVTACSVFGFHTEV